MAEENVESNAFLQTNETLSTGIREALLNIADAALSRKIIHENTHSEVLNLRHPIEVRTLSFLRAIRDRIRIDPQAFHVFVSILERQHSMEYLGTKLKESLENQKEDLKRRQAVSAASTHTNPSLTQGEMTIIKGGQPVIRQAIARPTQLVAPAREQQHSYAGMQHAKLPGKPVTFSNLNRYHSPGAPVHHRTSLATVTHPATTTVTVGNHEPLSEPVMKYHTTTSPGMMFRNNTVFGASMQEDNVSSTSDVNAVTRRAITPGPEASDSRTIFSSGLTGKNVPRIFRKNYSDLQQRLDLVSNTQDKPLPLSSPIGTPKYISTLQYPAPVTSSDNPSPSVTSRLQHLSITTDPATTGIAGDPHTVASSPGHTQFFNATQGKPGNEATRTVFHSSSANTGQLFTLPPPVDDNTTTHFSQGTGSFRYTEYPQPNSMVLEQIHAQSVCTPTQGSISTEPSGSTSHLHLNKTQTHDKPTDGHGNVTASSNNNMAMSTSMRMPTERTIPVSPNPPTASAWLIKEGGSNGPGVSESQTTAPGSDSLVYDHSVMRSPSLRSESSIESTDDSAEVDPIQASEQSEGAMFTITSGGLKPASCSKSGGGKRKRQRCEHCVKYKKESNDLKKELVELQRTLSREREQSNVQVAGFREEIYRVEQQANYEIAQCQIHIVRDAELRHHDASRIIQKLQRELQLVEKERDGFKNAYDSCLERCQMLQAELQRVDSMQCPDYCYEQYDNAIAPYPHNFNNYSAHTQEDSQVYGRLQQHP